MGLVVVAKEGLVDNLLGFAVGLKVGFLTWAPLTVGLIEGFTEGLKVGFVVGLEVDLAVGFLVGK